MKSTQEIKVQRQRRGERAVLVKSKAPIGRFHGEPYYSREELECRVMAENYQRQINDAELLKNRAEEEHLQNIHKIAKALNPGKPPIPLYKAKDGLGIVEVEKYFFLNENNRGRELLFDGRLVYASYVGIVYDQKGHASSVSVTLSGAVDQWVLKCDDVPDGLTYCEQYEKINYK